MQSKTNLPIWETILGKPYEVFLDNPTSHENLFKTDESIDYHRVLKCLRHELNRKHSAFGPPIAKEVSEATKSVFVESFLSTTLHFVKRRAGIEKSNKVRLVAEERCENDIEITQTTSNGVQDYVYTLRFGRHHRAFNVVEVKSGLVSEGVPQCILAMHRAFQLDPLKRRVFGMVSNGNDWQMLRVKKNKNGEVQWSISEVLHGVLHLLDQKESWLEGNGPVVAKWLYSVLNHHVQQAINEEATALPPPETPRKKRKIEDWLDESDPNEILELKKANQAKAEKIEELKKMIRAMKERGQSAPKNEEV